MTKFDNDENIEEKLKVHPNHLFSFGISMHNKCFENIVCLKTSSPFSRFFYKYRKRKIINKQYSGTFMNNKFYCIISKGYRKA